MTMFLSLIIFQIIQSVSLSELNIEDFFLESKCIEEPNEGFFTEYLFEQNGESMKYMTEDAEIKNHRSELNALAQFYKIQVLYEVVSEEGLPHEKKFNISLKLGDELYHGFGRSKKLAKEMAARIALENSKYAKPPEKITDDDNLTPTVVLNNIGAKHGYKIDYYMYDPLAATRIINLNKLKPKSLLNNITFWKEVAHLDKPPKSPFHIEVSIKDNSFFGKARTIQEAKHDAAAKAIEYLKAQGMDKNSVCTTFGGKKECKKAKEQLKSPITILHEYSLTKRLDLGFNLLSQSGPAHKPVFTFECVLGPMTTKGVGKSKKDAKRKAAEEMLENIPDLQGLSEDLSVKTREQKGKKKRNTFEIAGDAVKNVMNYLGGGEPDEKLDDEPKSEKKQSKKWSPKEKLLEYGGLVNLNLQFQTMQRKSDNGYFSLINLDLKPKYFCLGVGANQRISQEYASLNALKFLRKLDIIEDIEEEELEPERFSFDNFIWLASEES